MRWLRRYVQCVFSKFNSLPVTKVLERGYPRDFPSHIPNRPRMIGRRANSTLCCKLQLETVLAVKEISSQTNTRRCSDMNKANMNMSGALPLAFSLLLIGHPASLLAGPMNPSKAKIAAVDRFSAKAAHLQLRTANNHIPGPNEPVDFDTGPFVTQGLSPTTGKPVRYYNFDAQSATPGAIYVLYREGDAKPVPGQLDIIDTVPGENGYNDFRLIWKVSVPRHYVANTITSADNLLKSGYTIDKTTLLRNVPVVPDKSSAHMRLNGESPELQSAWYKDQVAKFFSFHESSLSVSDDSVPVSPIYVTFAINPDQPNGGPGSGFKTEPQSVQTHNVPSTLPGDHAYSPLWLVVVYDNADWSSVRDLSTVQKAKVLASGVARVNCPIVFIEH